MMKSDEEGDVFERKGQQMAKRKGLQTDISVIFNDVPVHRKNVEDNSAFAPAPKPKDTVSSKPQISESVITETTSPVEVEESAPKSFKRDKPRNAKLFATRQIVRTGQGVSPRRKRTSVALVFVLSIALVLLFARNFYAPQENFLKPEIAAAQQVKTAISFKPFEINWPIPPVYPENLRDPMEPIKIEIPEIPSGVIVSIDNKLFVVIGGQLLSEGGSIEGATIVEVSPDYVEFRVDRESWKQKIPRLIVRGIVHSEGIPLAVVGIDTVKEGDIIIGVTVVKINVNSVEFEVGGRRWTQKVEGKEDK